MGVHPNELDLRVRDAVRAPLAAYEGLFDLDGAWSDAAGMWITEVLPRRDGCADLSVAHDGSGDLSVTVGNAHFELWGVTETIDLDHLSDIVGSVAAGRVLESGNERDASIRITLDRGDVFRAGPFRVPWPGRWRGSRSYLPYG